MKKPILAVKKICYITIAILSIYLCSCKQSSSNIATSFETVESMVAQAQGGDTIIIANGTYRDVAIKLKGDGLKDAPIVITAETPGKVIISGNSTLQFGGDYLVVRGLLFTDGYTETSSVVSFKVGDKISTGCRFTNNAIVSYNPADKWDSYRWIALSGREHRIDHNSFVNKLNVEVMINVSMDEEESLEPRHRIDHNYFGPRHMLGSNSAEAIRVGHAQVSMIPGCGTIIENNYFEECDGEVEIVSIKSSDNIVRNNVFKRCAGVLALRHGDRNIAEGNLFDGDEKAATGGIRVVGAGHSITNNVFYKLRGVRLFSTLALMNAVPNSAPNRYMQVADIDVKNNSFYDCASIDFGTGSDNERTLAPDNIRFMNNSIYGNGYPAYINRSDISGFKFENNIIEDTKGSKAVKGLNEGKLTLTENDGVIVATEKSHSVGPDLHQFVSRSEVGANWQKLESLDTHSISGNTINVGASQNSLVDAIAKAENGDTIILTDDGEYFINTPIKINKYLIIKRAEDIKKRPTLRYNGKKSGPFIEIGDGGDLDIRGIAFRGEVIMGYKAPNAAIATAVPMIQPFGLNVDDCEFYGFYQNASSCIRIYKGGFADNLKFENSIFHNCSSEAINLSNEKDDIGRYNAEVIEIYNCVFFRMMAGALNLYRGGSDESTSGPTVIIEDCSFVDTNNREQGSVLRLIGAQTVRINSCNFLNSGSGGATIRLNEMRWDDIEMSNINLWESGRISTFWDLPVTNQTNIDPKFLDIEQLDFTVTEPRLKGVGAKI